MTKTPLPEIVANWNIHLAGLTAQKEARAKGITEGDSETLLNAAVGGKIIGGVTFPPIHAGFMLMMAKLAKMDKWTSLYTSELDNATALAFILQAPKIAWPLIREGHEDAFIEAVIEFSMEFSMGDIQEAFAWVNVEMDRLKAQGEAASKSKAE